MAESVERSDEQKAQDYSAMLGGVSVITNCLDDDNEFCNDMTSEEKKERVMRLWLLVVYEGLGRLGQ